MCLIKGKKNSDRQEDWSIFFQEMSHLILYTDDLLSVTLRFESTERKGTKLTKRVKDNTYRYGLEKFGVIILREKRMRGNLIET